MTTIDQKEYLKKYLGIGKGEKKKKKKHKIKIKSTGLKIVDDDIDVRLDEAIQEDLNGDNEDAPQIVSVIDDRPPSLRIDEKTNTKLWIPLGEIDEPPSEVSTVKFEGNIKLSKGVSSRKDLDSNKKVKIERRVSHDHSPPRQRSNSESPPRNKKNTTNIVIKEESITPERDFSPIRRHHKNEFTSPTRKSRDLSPARRAKYEDLSPSPKRTKNEVDLSPPRRSKNNTQSSSSKHSKSLDVDSSPPRKRKSVDLSPKRLRKDHDNLPPRRPKLKDNSPSRLNGLNSDNSPVRRRSPDSSPPRRRKSLDSSPPRRKRTPDSSPTRRRKMPDSSPPRRKTSDISPPRRRKTSDSSPPRRRKAPDSSPPRRRKSPATSPKRKKSRWGKNDEPDEKMKKTLDGKKAGLQNASDLVKETQELKRKEDELFKNMDAEISGANAATVVRTKTNNIDPEEEERKRKKEAETKEKYDKWGKGMKQVDDANDKLNNDLYEMSKPLARYADDNDLEQYLKQQERDGDPMLQYIRQKKRQKAIDAGIPMKQQYEGDSAPNRFGIRPGCRWDGVDRSSGYEKKWFEVQNSRTASIEETYKWSTEDM
ncbi:uncharacterized protein LOC143204138 [Rhynchophorus ferrugineus]|uniref:BUD13 homolog n=1 Tax=Rhynchophorus ferrugineus TaxID=354439 RepID=A0A834M683_RHYFE|nr:hypothetical protein GWI33_020159 [Rhynchophorus ferrugineus]